MEAENHLKAGRNQKAIRVGQSNTVKMKNLFKALTIIILCMSMSSYTGINHYGNLSRDNKTLSFTPSASENTDGITITYDSADVCGLKYLGSVKVTEKWWIYNNNGLKEETKEELRKQTFEKGGNIVFVNVKEKNGFGIFFTTTIEGYVYGKEN